MSQDNNGMVTQRDRLTALFDNFGLEFEGVSLNDQTVVVLHQGMVGTTGHYGLRAQFLFNADGSFHSHEVIDEKPEAP